MEKTLEYKTSNLPLAVFLLCKGVAIKNIESVDRVKKAFVFYGTYPFDNKIELTTSALADVYLYGKLIDDNPDLIVNVRDYEMSRNRLLDLMNE